MKRARSVSVALVLACFILILGTGSALAYSDVPSDSWFYAPVKKLSSKNIITGYPDGTFRPNNSITRAEFAVTIAKALDLNTEDTSMYRDINGNRNSGYIGSVSNAGVMTGYPDGTFRPDNKITRAEVASTIVRAYKLGKSWGNYTLFDDTFDHWAEQNIRVANQNGIVNGYPSDLFKPNAQATQAEVCAMISRAIYASEPIHANGETKTSGSIQLFAQKWLYENSIYDSGLDFSWTPPAGKRFVSIGVTVKNVGSDAIRLNKHGFKLHLTNGQKIDPDVDYYDDAFELRGPATNASETGMVTFSVPKDTDIAYIAYDYLGVKFPIKVTL
ncbi:MAG: S-layer homology domain-containing protein [Actinobacteria bacterium]|nr:S-layer homology domain-containing protein [Actinomycetota bacterium]